MCIETKFAAWMVAYYWNLFSS